MSNVEPCVCSLLHYNQTLLDPPFIQRRGRQGPSLPATPPTPHPYFSPSQRVCVSSKPGLCPRLPLCLWLCFFPNPSCYSGARFLTSNNTFPPLPSHPPQHPLPLQQVCCAELRKLQVASPYPLGGERRVRPQAGELKNLRP